MSIAEPVVCLDGGAYSREKSRSQRLEVEFRVSYDRQTVERVSQIPKANEQDNIVHLRGVRSLVRPE